VTRLLVLLALLAAPAQEALAPGKSRLVEESRVELVAGDAPVILSAPHGGRLKPEGVADRKAGVLLADTNTDLLAREFGKAFHALTGRHAHLVFCHLHRVKVDCNRPLDDATEGDPQAQATWRAYHLGIAEARAAVARVHGRGLYLDLHGHAHPEPRIELGYLLKHSELKEPDEALGGMAARSSVRDLAGRTKAGFLELLRGPTSLGGLLEKRGFASVPSPKHPHNGDGPYFNGGYSTLAHGSREAGTISAVQLETPGPGVRSGEESRKKFAAALAEAVVEYLRIHAGIDLKP